MGWKNFFETPGIERKDFRLQTGSGGAQAPYARHAIRGLQAVDEIQSLDGIAADAHAGALAQAQFGGLVHRLVGQGAGASPRSACAKVSVG